MSRGREQIGGARRHFEESQKLRALRGLRPASREALEAVLENVDIIAESSFSRRKYVIDRDGEAHSVPDPDYATALGCNKYAGEVLKVDQVEIVSDEDSAEVSIEWLERILESLGYELRKKRGNKTKNRSE